MTPIPDAERIIAQFGGAYLVGSANWPLVQHSIDRDYVLEGDPRLAASALARRFRGRAFTMDAERGYWRMVAPRLPVIDIAPAAGGSLATDLARRDFTVNAVARSLPAHRALIDPFRGLADWRYGLVRQVSLSSMPDDPLRIVRGVRLVAERGFILGDETRWSMVAAAPLLRSVAGERLRVELLRVLAGQHWERGAALLGQLGVWQALPLSRPLQTNPVMIAAMLAELSAHQATAESLAARVGRGSPPDHARWRALAVLAAVLHVAGRDGDAGRLAAQELRLSRNEVGAIGAIQAMLVEMTRVPAPSAVTVFHWLEQHGAGTPWAAALLGRRDVLASVAEMRMEALGRLPDGGTLSRALGQEPGPWLGEALRHLRTAEATGELAPGTAIDEARRWWAQYQAEAQEAAEP